MCRDQQNPIIESIYIVDQTDQSPSQQQQITTATATTTTTILSSNPNDDDRQPTNEFHSFCKQQSEINSKLTTLCAKVHEEIHSQHSTFVRLIQILEKIDRKLPVTDECTTTFGKEIPSVSENLIEDQIDICIDNETKLALHGLRQYYVKLRENEKNQKLIDLLHKLEFNHVVIFVKSVPRCTALCKLLIEQNIPAIESHHGLSEEERLARYKEFKESQTRILVATNLLGRRMDIERVNIVFNYDMPEDTDAYLHRITCARRLGTKKLVITYVAHKSDTKILREVEERFEIQITEMPDEIDVSTYIENR